MIKNRLTQIGFSLLIPLSLLLAIGLFVPNQAEAGIYSENSETTYQENWIPHSEFTGSCGESGGKWYIEPWDCEKEMEFTLPNVNNINKIEIYIDLWRNKDAQSSRFKINNGSAIKPNVGSDWSRTPYIHEFTGSELNDFVTGTNTITFWDAEGPYHVHDVSIRIYSNASDVATTEGSLHKIVANNVEYDPYNAGASTLTVDNDQLQVSANVSGTARFVEFHAFYDGYDEDNDGDFSDWHNLNNNNWNDGASNNAPGIDNPNPILGGTINHIQTLEVTTPGIYTATWNIPHIVSQDNVRFKIRIVDNNNNVRDAAGGDSRNFTLERSNPSAYFINSNFEDAVLHHGGDPGFEDEYSTTVVLPDDISDYDSAYIIGAYYANLWITVNGSPQFRAFQSPANHTGRWDLSIWNNIPLGGGNTSDLYNYLQPGVNTIGYSYWNASNQWGSFIEKPGPMIVLKKENGSLGSDSTPPDMYNPMPVDGAVFVEPDTNVSFYLIDPGSGVNNGSIDVEINNVSINPTLTSGPSGTRVFYNPPSDFAFDQDVTVEVSACDNSANCMTDSFMFRTLAEDTGATAVSDDFNSCLINDNGAGWSFVDPVGDSSFAIGEDYETVEIFVPGGNTHDPVGTNTSARLMQSASNAPNFVLETKFLSVPSEKFQVQGLIIEQDANDYIRFDMVFDGSVLRAYVNTAENGVMDTGNPIAYKLLPDATRYILINRIDASNWELHHSIDGVTWKPVVQFSHNMVVNNVGIYAGNAPSGQNQPPEFTAVFDYVLDWGAPFADGEDGDSLILPTAVEGEGTVSKDIECGKPVELTATPELGWSFDRWSGASNSTQNPVTVNDWNEGDTITAIFTRDEYTVTIDSASFDHTGAQTTDGAGGSVQQSQATYYYGDTVTLTATPSPGWALTSWSGAGTSGDNLVETFTVFQNETINVRFDQEKYTYNLTQTGPGNVTIDSLGVGRGYFIYGDSVTLTAVETDPDFLFRNWSGAVNSTQNPVTFTLMGEFNVSVLFSDEINIFLPLVIR